MNPNQVAEQAGRIADAARALADQAQGLAGALAGRVGEAAGAAHAGIDPFVFLLTIFLLACFVGYYVVWSVTPALHSPLMAVTNAISSVIIVGALLSVGLAASGFAGLMGFLAVLLASVNIFGGFLVTQRMLQMFKKKAK
ncbi:MAG: NAD(P) transhydrogenase subunit alpha [Acetobacteraceae bacterium]|nr:NAD(P) transhydrogenase subunit alpha [Acetobacteraceae bacterium]